MLFNLLIFRSLTRAQRASVELDRAGIPNRIIRTPKAVSEEGCSHCVRLSQRYLLQAKERLSALDIEPQKIYITAGDDVFEEVRF